MAFYSVTPHLQSETAFKLMIIRVIIFKIFSKRLKHLQHYEQNELNLYIQFRSMASLRNQYRKEYSAWYNMIRRCYKQGLDNQEWYYDKGVTVCPEWLNSFETFFADMGKAPSKEHSLDRVEGSTVYSKDTCKWSTQTEQTRNRGEFNIVREYLGESLCLAEWAERYGLKRAVLYYRVVVLGWDIGQALTTPYENTKIQQKVTNTGTGQEFKSVNMAAKVSGIAQPKLWAMLHGKAPNTSNFVFAKDYKPAIGQQFSLF